MTPFILLGRKELPLESEPSDEQVYDKQRQLWIDKGSGTPLVIIMTTSVQQSNFGETTITETREGADQLEVAGFRASQFGETTITKTFEGTDQTEHTTTQHSGIAASRFGETQVTATREGSDQSELVALEVSQFGETTLTRTIEGVDQPEILLPKQSLLTVSVPPSDTENVTGHN